MTATAARVVYALAFLLVLACACVVFGAVPWLSVPTLGQAVWASGFALSFANAGGLSIYATDFGFPHPAPIAFGLSFTLVQASLIRWLGTPAMDAYTLTTVFFFALSLWGACAYARHLGASRALALPLGLLWLVLPIVVQHVSYSMVALGFALLPFYLLMLHRLVQAVTPTSTFVASAGFVVTCVVSVFMDGYTFVMFAVASAVLLAGMLLANLAPRKKLLLHAAPCVALGFGLAYVLYSAYIGNHQYRPPSLDFFRGWGVDVTMLLAPSRGVHWVWDRLSLGTERSMALYWGDASVWITTFIAPLLVTGLTGFALARKRKYASILLAIALAGTYLALGPSLKFHSTKQVPGITAEESGQLMPEKYAVGPTGSAVFSENVPGFNLMRASYRWMGLGALGLWGLTIVLTVGLRRRSPFAAGLVAPLLIILMLPNVDRTWKIAKANRSNSDAMESALVEDLAGVAPGGMLFFAPHGNDFVANYMAPRAGFRTYNIGGDKNVEMAQAYWSDQLLRLGPGQLQQPSFQDDLRAVLLTGQADAVVIPYFDMLWAPHRWPPTASSIAELRAQRLPVARASASAPCFTLDERPLFAVVKLNEQGRLALNAAQTAEAASDCSQTKSSPSAPAMAAGDAMANEIDKS